MPNNLFPTPQHPLDLDNQEPPRHSAAHETWHGGPGGAPGSEREVSGPKPRIGWEPWIAGTPRILIVTDDDRIAEKLALVFRHAGLAAERARNMMEGADSARSGRFPVVVTTPELKDGSWKRLALIARHYRPGFAIILVAKRFDLREWAQALDDGALDVLDALYELPRAAEAAKRALWTEYLTGAWPNFVVPGPKQAS
jgi:hypothetical protein